MQDSEKKGKVMRMLRHSLLSSLGRGMVSHRLRAILAKKGHNYYCEFEDKVQ